MTQSQSDPHSVDNDNLPLTTPVDSTIVDVKDPKSIDTVDQQQQTSSKRKNRLDKAVDHFSTRRILIQLVLLLITSIIQLNFGIRHMDNCPIQPRINTFLIVHGAVGLVHFIDLILAYTMAKYIKRSLGRSPRARCVLVVGVIIQLVLILFNFAWWIAGQIWVFGAKANGFQSTDPSQDTTFCHRSVFWTAFIVVIATSVIWLIIISVMVGRRIKKRCQS